MHLIHTKEGKNSYAQRIYLFFICQRFAAICRQIFRDFFLETNKILRTIHVKNPRNLSNSNDNINISFLISFTNQIKKKWNHTFTLSLILPLLQNTSKLFLSRHRKFVHIKFPPRENTDFKKAREKSNCARRATAAVKNQFWRELTAAPSLIFIELSTRPPVLRQNVFCFCDFTIVFPPKFEDATERNRSVNLRSLPRGWKRVHSNGQVALEKQIPVHKAASQKQTLAQTLEIARETVQQQIFRQIKGTQLEIKVGTNYQFCVCVFKNLCIRRHFWQYCTYEKRVSWFFF